MGGLGQPAMRVGASVSAAASASLGGRASRPRRLPPLTALRAFEAVGRLGVAEAARRLNVTRAAVLHQVRVLEGELGLELFVRSNKGLTLSDTGRVYLAEVVACFEAIQDSSRRIKGAAGDDGVVLDCSAMIAADFVAPRLHRFTDANPQIKVEIRSRAGAFCPAEFEAAGANVAIRRASEARAFPGLRAEKIADEVRFPVCSPALLKGERPLRRPADLAHFQLLDGAMGAEGGGGLKGWRQWLRSASLAGEDVSCVQPERARRFDQHAMSMTAAIHGAGVDLGRSPLVDHWIDEGILVAPFALGFASDVSYWLICREEFAQTPLFAAFRSWLLDEFGAQDGRRSCARTSPVLAGHP